MSFGPSKHGVGNGWGNDDDSDDDLISTDRKYKFKTQEERNRYDNKKTEPGDILCAVATAVCIVATAGFISSLFSGGGKNKTKRKKIKRKRRRITSSRRSYP